jgi:hypothetical protein
VKLRSAWPHLLIAGLAVGSTLAVVLTRHRPTTAETEARAKNLLRVFREDEISRIAFGGATSFALERRGPAEERAWVLAPSGERADQEAVERVIAALGFAVPARIATETPGAAGIDENGAKIEIAAGDARYELRLGTPVAPPDGAAYLELRAEGAPGSGVYVVPRDVAALFSTDLDSLRDARLLAWGEHSLASLELETKAGKTRLDHARGLAWKLASGQRASRAALEPVFDALAGLKLEKFLEHQAARSLVGGTPSARVRATPREGTALTLDFGPACPGDPERVVVVDPSPSGKAGCTSRTVLDRLTLDPSSLVDRFPFSARADEVEEIAIERGGRSLVLVRKGTAFLLRKPSEAQVGVDAGNARVNALVRAPADIVPSPNPKELGLAPPEGRVKVLSPGDEKGSEEIVELGKRLPDGTLYLRRDDGIVLALSRDAARAFEVDTTLLRSPSLLSFSQSELVDVTLSAPEPQELRRGQTGSLELAKPRGFAVDSALATELGFTLGALTAQSFVADRDDGSFGLGKPRSRTTVSFENGDAGARTRTLLIGAGTRGGYYARFEEDPAVFVLDRETVEKIEQLFVDRTRFVVDPASITRIELESGGERVVLAERNGALAPVSPADLSPALIQGVLDTLGALRADATLHTGAARPEQGFAKPRLEVRIERKADAGKPVAFTLGAADEHDGVSVFFARIEGVDATFAIAKSKLRPLLDLF